MRSRTLFLLLCATLCSTFRTADSGSSNDPGRSWPQPDLVPPGKDETLASFQEKAKLLSSFRTVEAESATPGKQKQRSSGHAIHQIADVSSCRRTCWRVDSSSTKPVLRLEGGSGMEWVDRRLSEALESAVRPRGENEGIQSIQSQQVSKQEDTPEVKARIHNHSQRKLSEKDAVSKKGGSSWLAAKMENAFLSEFDSSLTPSNSQPPAQDAPAKVGNARGEKIALLKTTAVSGESLPAPAQVPTTPSDQMSRCSDPEEGDTTRSCRETAFDFNSRRSDSKSIDGNNGDRWWEKLENVGMTPQPEGLVAAGAAHRFLTNLNSNVQASSATEGLEVPISPGSAYTDPTGADRWFRHTLSNYPASADVHAMYANFLHFVDGNHEAATAMYRRALEISTNHVQSVCGIAVLMFEERRQRSSSGPAKDSGRRKASIEMFWGELESFAELARKEKRNAGLAQFVHGLWLELKGDTLGAEKEYRSFLTGTESNVTSTQNTPRDWFTSWERTRFKAEALCRLGAMLEEAHERTDEAKDVYIRAQEADPRVADGFRLHANVLMKRSSGVGREEEVEGLLRRAISAQDSDVDALSDYGHFLHVTRRDCYEAERYYRKALAICPRHKVTLRRYSQLLDKDLCDYKAAKEMCKRALEVEEDAESLSLYGRLLHDEEQDYDAAEEIYKKVLDMDLTCVEVMHDYGRLLEEVRRDTPAAERMYRRALKVNSQHVPTLTNLGLLLEEHHGNIEGAEDMYRRALEADPTDVGTLYNYALLLLGRSDHDGAEALFKRLLAVEPNDRDTLHVYGNLLLDHRRDACGAETLFQRALHANQQDLAVLCDYGRLLQGQRRNLEAEEKYKRALAIDPQHEVAMRNYASLLHDELHSFDKAEALYKQILECNPSSTAKASVLCNYARLLQEEKRDYDAAQSLYRMAIDYGVMDVRAMRAYARLLDEVRGDFHAARRFYKKVLESDPAEAGKELYSVGNSRRLASDHEGAENLLSLLLELPECNGTHANASWTLAGIMAESGRFRHAHELYRQALERNPDFVDQAYHIAKRWEQQGVDGFSRGLYSLVLTANAEHGPSAWMLARALEAMSAEEPGAVHGDCNFGKGDVVGLLRTALQSNLSMVEDVYVFGAAREGRGDLEGCLEVYEMIVNQTHGNHFPSMSRTCFVLHKSLRDFDRAETMYARAVETCTFDDGLMLGYGQLLEVNRHDPMRAQACYRRAEACNPTNIEVLLNLAMSLHRSGRDLGAARMLYERAVVLASDRAALAQSRKGMRGVAVDADMHVMLLTSYADLLREHRLGSCNAVEDLYLAVLQHDSENEQALLGQLLLMLDAGRDKDLVVHVMLKLVSKGNSNARLWLEYGKWCLGAGRRKAKSAKEAFAVAVVVRTCHAVFVSVTDAMLRSEVWAKTSSADSSLDAGVTGTGADCQPDHLSDKPNRADSDSTLAIEGGDVDMDWGSPPSQRVSEIIGGLQESSEAEPGWHDAQSKARASGAEFRSVLQVANHEEEEGLHDSDTSTKTISFSVQDEEYPSEPGREGWEFNISFGSSPVSSTSAREGETTSVQSLVRSSTTLSRSDQTDLLPPGPIAAGQNLEIRWPDDDNFRASTNASGSEGGGVDSPTQAQGAISLPTPDAAPIQPFPQHHPTLPDRETTPELHPAPDVEEMHSTTSPPAAAPSAAPESSASEQLTSWSPKSEPSKGSTPQTPQTPEEAAMAPKPDQWDTFVNAHKTRSLQHLPEFSTPRSSWPLHNDSPVPACALPRPSAAPDHTDSISCTPNCTKPLKSFSALPAANSLPSRGLLSSTSPSLPMQHIADAGNPLSSMAQDTLPCADADGSLPAACAAPLHSSSARHVGGVNAAFLVTPSSESASTSPNDMARLASIFSDLPLTTPRSRLRPPRAGLRPPMLRQPSRPGRARSPIRVRTIQNGEVDAYRKPRVGMESWGPGGLGGWREQGHRVQKRKLRTLVKHVRLSEDGESTDASADGELPQLTWDDGAFSQPRFDAPSPASVQPAPAREEVAEGEEEREHGAGSAATSQREASNADASDKALPSNQVGMDKQLQRVQSREVSLDRQGLHNALDEEAMQELFHAADSESPLEGTRNTEGDGASDSPDAEESCDVSAAGSVPLSGGSAGRGKRAPSWKVVGAEKRRRREEAREAAARRLDAALDGLKHLVGSPASSPRQRAAAEAAGGYKDVVIATAAWRGPVQPRMLRPRVAMTPRAQAAAPTPSRGLIQSSRRGASLSASVEQRDGGLERLQLPMSGDSRAGVVSPAVARSRSICVNRLAQAEIAQQEAGTVSIAGKKRETAVGMGMVVGGAVSGGVGAVLAGAGAVPASPSRQREPDTAQHNVGMHQRDLVHSMDIGARHKEVDCSALASSDQAVELAHSRHTPTPSQPNDGEPSSGLDDGGVDADRVEGDSSAVVVKEQVWGAVQRSPALAGAKTILVDKMAESVMSTTRASETAVQVTIGMGLVLSHIVATSVGTLLSEASRRSELTAAPDAAEQRGERFSDSAASSAFGVGATSEGVDRSDKMEVDSDEKDDDDQGSGSIQVEMEGSDLDQETTWEEGEEERDGVRTRSSDESHSPSQWSQPIDPRENVENSHKNSESQPEDEGHRWSCVGADESRGEEWSDGEWGEREAAEDAAEERCEEAQKRLSQLRKAALEGAGNDGFRHRLDQGSEQSSGLTPVMETTVVTRARQGPLKPWDERVFSALRGIALRREMSRAEKHKVVGVHGKVSGVLQGQCFLARAAGAPGWLRVTDKRFAIEEGQTLYLPMSTVTGEELVVEVSSLVDDRDGQRRQEPAASQKGTSQLWPAHAQVGGM